jgi:hypothetical protein
MLVQRKKIATKSKHAKYGIVALKNHVPLSLLLSSKCNSMTEEILDTKDDGACVKISNFIPFWMVLLTMKYFSF